MPRSSSESSLASVSSGVRFAMIYRLFGALRKRLRLGAGGAGGALLGGSCGGLCTKSFDSVWDSAGLTPVIGDWVLSSRDMVFVEGCIPAPAACPALMLRVCPVAATISCCMSKSKAALPVDIRGCCRLSGRRGIGPLSWPSPTADWSTSWGCNNETVEAEVVLPDKSPTASVWSS